MIKSWNLNILVIVVNYVSQRSVSAIAPLRYFLYLLCATPSSAIIDPALSIPTLLAMQGAPMISTSLPALPNACIAIKNQQHSSFIMLITMSWYTTVITALELFCHWIKTILLTCFNIIIWWSMYWIHFFITEIICPNTYVYITFCCFVAALSWNVVK